MFITTVLAISSVIVEEKIAFTTSIKDKEYLPMHKQHKAQTGKKRKDKIITMF